MGLYRGSRVRSPPVPVVLSVYQRGSLLDGLAMYLSCGTTKLHDNESTHVLHNFLTSTHSHRGGSFRVPELIPVLGSQPAGDTYTRLTAPFPGLPG